MTAPDYADLRLSLTTTLQTTPDHLLGKRTAIVNASRVLALLDEREALIRERDEALAKVEAVEALADEWVAPGGQPDLPLSRQKVLAALRAALADGGTT